MTRKSASLTKGCTTAQLRHDGRAAADRTRDGVRHAVEVVIPYAEAARGAAAHYTDEARQHLAPKVASAVDQARRTTRTQLDTRVVPLLEQAREAVPPKVEHAVESAAQQTRRTVRQAADHALPLVESAVAATVAATVPVRDEAVTRSAAALAALRGGVTAEEIEQLVRRHRRRERNGRFAKRLLAVGALAGGAWAAWNWWNRQTTPDWLVEAPAPTELGDRSPQGATSTRAGLEAVDGSGPAAATGATEAGAMAEQAEENRAEAIAEAERTQAEAAEKARKEHEEGEEGERP
ncbi:DUF5324 family protein [Streptomyces sp. SCUT-3]|uniref:DUF5324 family protein n=1 Tax=Streptomyces sp. SCUT-3 TaxID=2684469 RepID=UPI00217550E9|nr:DUF5324 family protein [Streptomyces sp. SCUT-3]